MRAGALKQNSLVSTLFVGTRREKHQMKRRSDAAWLAQVDGVGVASGSSLGSHWITIRFSKIHRSTQSVDVITVTSEVRQWKKVSTRVVGKKKKNDAEPVSRRGVFPF